MGRDEGVELTDFASGDQGHGTAGSLAQRREVLQDAWLDSHGRGIINNIGENAVEIEKERRSVDIQDWDRLIRPDSGMFRR